MAASGGGGEDDAIMLALEGRGTWRGLTGEMMLDVAEALDIEPRIAARVTLVVVKLQASIRARAGRREYGKILQKHYMDLEAAEAAQERARLEEGLALLERVNTERELMDARLLSEASRHAASQGNVRSKMAEAASGGGDRRAASFRDAMLRREGGSRAAGLDLGGEATAVEEDPWESDDE